MKPRPGIRNWGQRAALLLLLALGYPQVEATPLYELGEWPFHPSTELVQSERLSAACAPFMSTSAVKAPSCGYFQAFYTGVARATTLPFEAGVRTCLRQRSAQFSLTAIPPEIRSILPVKRPEPAA